MIQNANKSNLLSLKVEEIERKYSSFVRHSEASCLKYNPGNSSASFIQNKEAQNMNHYNSVESNSENKDKKLVEFIQIHLNSSLLSKLFIKISDGKYYFGSKKIELILDENQTSLLGFII